MTDVAETFASLKPLKYLNVQIFEGFYQLAVL